ncbi:MAG: ATP-binding protein [Aldersonia sp.]|nr:ATP-binding protein [Aldersonia sp.]
MTSEQPTLVLMAGPPGAGKTTLALAVGRALGWPVIDKDTLKSALLTNGVAETLAGPAAYELLHDLGCDLLVQQRLSVILDSPAAYPIVVEKATTLAREAGAVLRVVLCLADRTERERRLSERLIRPSQRNADVGLIGDDARQWGRHLPADSLVVRTTQPVDELLPETLVYVLAPVDGGRSVPP